MAIQKFSDVTENSGFDEIYNGVDDFIGTVYKRDDGLFPWFAQSSNETGNATGSFETKDVAIFWLEELDATKGM